MGSDGGVRGDDEQQRSNFPQTPDLRPSVALSEGTPAEKFGRVPHLPQAQLAAVIDGMRARGLIGSDGWLTTAGRQTKERVESLTDELAAPAYDTLEPGELDQLVEVLEPLAAVLVTAGSQ